VYTAAAAKVVENRMNDPAALIYWKRCSFARSYGGVLLSGAVKIEGRENSSSYSRSQGIGRGNKLFRF
jgi:hypothetical protein